MSQLQVTGEAKIRDIQGPVVANDGVITALDGAANQYVRGDGTLANFPTSGGGGSSVSYYLNGSVNQGTFGGSTYYQMSKNAITGVGTNFSASANGLIAQFITDANDPDVVSIPSGNWNVEFFMNVSASSGALASFYVEIYKYDGSTFTLLATNVATPEQLTNTTTVDAYFTSVAMPLSSMAITDRLAIRIFVNVASKTVTLYTENNRLCQVITTFSNGLTSLNNLTDQSQYLTTGTSGTNFAIVSSGDTHTFNLPVASASNTGKLSSTDWSTFNNKQNALTLTTTGSSGAATLVGSTLNIPDYSVNTTNFVTIGTVQTITGTKTFDNAIRNESGLLLKNGVISGLSGYTSLGGNISNGLVVQLSGSTNQQNLLFQTGGAFSYTFPASTGTLALTSDLSSYVPTSRTLTINGETYDLSANRSWTISTGISGSGADGRVAYWNGTNSITSEAGFIYDASTNRLGVNTSVPNATIGADAGLDSGYGLLIKTGSANYNGIGIAVDSTYGNLISTEKLGSASARNLTLLNQSGFVSLRENGNFGVNTLNPAVSGTGIDVYSSTSTGIRFHTATSGLTVNDGAGINFSAANNLGITNYENGTIDIVTNGNSGVFVAANGFVGINGATPSVALTVNGGAAISNLTTGQIVFPTSGGTLSGTNSLFWDNTNAKLGIGTNVLSGARVTISSTTEANHLQLVSNAPALTFINAISFTHYATVGMATANNNFITGAVLGDLVLGAYNTNNIWFYNANTNTVRMRIDSDGGGTFSSFVSASGPKSQIRVNGNSVGCGIALTNTIVGANRRNWGIFTEQDAEGDFVIKRSNFSGSEPQSGTTILSLSRTGAATFSSSVTATNMLLQSNSTTTQTLKIVPVASQSASILNIVNSADTVNLLTVTSAGNVIMNGGNVGIGTTNPAYALDVTNNFRFINTTQGSLSGFFGCSDTGSITLNFGGTTSPTKGRIVYSDFSDTFLFLTNSTERMRITSGGDVLVGTSNADSSYRLMVAKNGANAYMGITNQSGANGDRALRLGFSSSGTVATIQGTRLSVADDVPIALQAGGGDVLFGTTTSFNSSKFTFNGGAGRGVGITNSNTGAHTLQVNNSSGSYSDLGGGMLFINQDGNATETGFRAISVYTNSGARFAVRGDGTIYSTNTSVQSISDIRFKENIRSLDSSIDKIMQIEPKIFDWKKGKGTGEKNVAGFIAQEIEKILPDIVSEFKDNIEDSTLYKSVGYSSLIPYLVKAIQEQQAQIEELKELIKNK